MPNAAVRGQKDRAEWNWAARSQVCFVAKLGGAGHRFGDYVCVDCAYFPCTSGCNQFITTQLTRPINKISKSICGLLKGGRRRECRLIFAEGGEERIM